MAHLVEKRCSEPHFAQQFFQAIEFIRKQRQIANIPRIIKYLEREFNYKSIDILQNLHKAVVDGLVVETITVGCKGSKAGVEQEGYWIPDKEQMLYDKEGESHDWYCFICHNPGKLLACASCPLVYHPTCLGVNLEEENYDSKWICPSCANVVKEEDKQEHQELARCLNFIVSQQSDLASDLKSSLEEQAMYHDFFVYTYYDLNTLFKDCQKGVFSSVEEFQYKVKLILHNYWIMFGEKHKLTKAAKHLVDECLHELEELRLCKSCFFLSNTKPMKDWFCQPCDPPHQVVWAKQKGFDYWPAKVIQVEDSKIDVRFFGKHHPRAWLPIDAVRGIAVSPSEFKIKRKQHWKLASAEMKEYIRQCECALGQDEASKIIIYDSPYGIGRNERLLEAMNALGKHEKGSLSSLNFDLNNSKVKRDSFDAVSPNSSKQGLSVVEVKEESNNTFSDNCSTDDCDFDVVMKEKLPEVVITHAQKRQADKELEFYDTASKRLKFDATDACTQTDRDNSSHKQTQVIPADLDGHPCNCKSRYNLILQKFKDYVIESNRLQKGKIIRAAAFKAAFEQRQVEDQARKDVTAEFEDAVAQLKANHQKELDEIKLKQWCCLCRQEALLHCCRNTNYCSRSCKDEDLNQHKPVCEATNPASTSDASNDASHRPKRIIKPKIY